jgi:hypothetical protein
MTRARRWKRKPTAAALLALCLAFPDTRPTRPVNRALVVLLLGAGLPPRDPVGEMARDSSKIR